MAIYNFGNEDENEKSEPTHDEVSKFACTECGCTDFVIDEEDKETGEMTLSCDSCGEDYRVTGVVEMSFSDIE